MKDVYCDTCKYCDLYEDENWKPSTTHICNITEEFIDDIEEDYCENYEEE